jgi:hypothetical protein
VSTLSNEELHWGYEEAQELDRGRP